MTPDAQTLKHIVSWVKQLHDVVPAHSDQGPPTKEKWAVLAALLANDYPSGAFTTASLHATAQGITYFPVYEVIRQRVGAWWQVNRPAVARTIEDPRYRGLGQEERLWMMWWDAAVARGFKGKGENDPPMNISTMSSLLRQKAPRVWDRLNPGSEPADYDAQQTWLAQDWDDDEGVYALVQRHGGDAAAMTLLRMLLSKHAPHLLYMVPATPALAESVRGGSPAVSGGRAAPLTPMQLQAARERIAP